MNRQRRVAHNYPAFSLTHAPLSPWFGAASVSQHCRVASGIYRLRQRRRSRGLRNHSRVCTRAVPLRDLPRRVWTRVDARGRVSSLWGDSTPVADALSRVPRSVAGPGGRQERPSDVASRWRRLVPVSGRSRTGPLHAVCTDTKRPSTPQTDHGREELSRNGCTLLRLTGKQVIKTPQSLPQYHNNK